MAGLRSGTEKEKSSEVSLLLLPTLHPCSGAPAPVPLSLSCTYTDHFLRGWKWVLTPHNKKAGILGSAITNSNQIIIKMGKTMAQKGGMGTTFSKMQNFPSTFPHDLHNFCQVQT